MLARGVIVSLCTGRMYSGTRPVAAQLGLKTPVACVDGCHIVQSNTHESLLRRPIPSEAKAGLHTLLSATDLAVFGFSDDIIVYDGRGRVYLEYLRTWSTQMCRVPDVLAPDSWDRFDELTALVVIGSQTSTEAIVQGVRATCSEAIQLAHFRFCEDTS